MRRLGIDIDFSSSLYNMGLSPAILYALWTCFSEFHITIDLAFSLFASRCMVDEQNNKFCLVNLMYYCDTLLTQ